MNETMLTYETLSTEKYWVQSAKAELRDHRREQNKAAVRSLFQFLFACGMILFVAFAVQTMPNWLPIVNQYLTDDVQRINAFLQNQGVIE